MNRRFSPNRSWIRLWCRTVRATDVLPIPPAPTRATGSRFSASPTTSSINLSRPKQSLGGGGGNSPKNTLGKCEVANTTVPGIANLVRAWVMVSIPLLVNSKSHLPRGFCRIHLQICFDAYPQPSCWYRVSGRSERVVLSIWIPNRLNRTYVEDVKDPDKILLPSSNFILIALGEDEPIYRLPFTVLDDIPLDLSQSSVIENVSSWVTLGARCRSGSRSQLSNRVEDRLVELTQPSPLGRVLGIHHHKRDRGRYNPDRWILYPR